MVSTRQKDVTDAVWAKCSGCGEIIYNGELSRNIRICPKCDYYFPLAPMERVALLADNKGLTKYDSDNTKPINGNLGIERAVLTGEIRLSGCSLVIATVDLESHQENQDSTTIIPSVSSKIIEAISRAVHQRLPFLLCINSFSQETPSYFAGISAVVSRLDKEKLLFISLLAQSDNNLNFPGFAYLADIVIAESKVSLDLHTNLKPGKNAPPQGPLSLLHNGLVDMIVPRREIKTAIASIIRFFC